MFLAEVCAEKAAWIDGEADRPSESCGSRARKPWTRTDLPVPVSPTIITCVAVVDEHLEQELVARRLARGHEDVEVGHARRCTRRSG